MGLKITWSEALARCSLTPGFKRPMMCSQCAVRSSKRSQVGVISAFIIIGT